MTFISSAHSVLSNSSWIFLAMLGLWGLFRSLRNQAVNPSYLGALIIGEVLILLQGILGTILWIGGSQPGRSVHLLYGVFAVILLPALFAYLRGDDSNRAQWTYAIGVLFLFVVALRAITTGV